MAEKNENKLNLEIAILRKQVEEASKRPAVIQKEQESAVDAEKMLS